MVVSPAVYSPHSIFRPCWKNFRSGYHSTGTPFRSVKLAYIARS